METPKFLQNIDWSQLKDQKNDILNTIDDLQYEAKQSGSCGQDDLMNRYNKQANSLIGILNLIDSIQDYAVDEMGMKEEDVFNLATEQYDRKDLEAMTREELVNVAMSYGIFDLQENADCWDRIDLIDEIMDYIV